jgi:hypothetical protein
MQQICYFQVNTHSWWKLCKVTLRWSIWGFCSTVDRESYLEILPCVWESLVPISADHSLSRDLFWVQATVRTISFTRHSIKKSSTYRPIEIYSTGLSLLITLTEFHFLLYSPKQFPTDCNRDQRCFSPVVTGSPRSTECHISIPWHNNISSRTHDCLQTNIISSLQ